MSMAEIKFGSIRKIYCNTCKGQTRHELMATHTRQYQDIQGEDTPFPQLVYWAEWEYKFWVCRGCDTGILEEAYTDQPMSDYQENPIIDSTYYPRREREVWPQKRFRHLDPKLAIIYGEAISTFN